jgi:hypothetical protein
MPLDSSQGGELFPTISAGETTVVPPGLKHSLLIELRRRRTGALVPPSAWASVMAVTRPIAMRTVAGLCREAMLQLVVTHILCLHERGNARTPNFHHRTLRIPSPCDWPWCVYLNFMSFSILS